MASCPPPLRPSETAAELVYPNGNRVRYLATGASTGGLFGLYRWEMGPEVSGPGPHFHRTMAESFYVLTGRSRSSTAAPGCRHEPATGSTSRSAASTGSGTSRARRPACSSTSRRAAPREGYFEGLARFARDGMPDADELAAFYAAHDNHWVG